ncbi:ParB/RepB/Spo0J family partition protein [Streptomyces sp. NPDC093261]|uniref:ParB/RepB/Spo0J family partition protein n=1 Tax=Streptomyces sp. NPDC093261 TaxID=3366037 RepID=UPI0037FAB31C
MGAEYLETRTVPLDELTPYPGNAKRGKVEAIRESIRRNGQYRSLVVRDTGGAFVVLAGNHTMLGLQAEGHTEARCELIRCDDATARRINLADNRTSELGSMDGDALLELLQAADAEEGLDGTGYTDEDLSALLGRVEELPPEGDAATEDMPGVWGVVVECDDEHQQTELLERLAGEGWRVRALIG